MQTKLIIEFNQNLFQGALFLPLLSIASIFLIMSVNQWGLLGKLIQVVMLIFNVLCIGAVVNLYYIWKHPEPAAIIDASGIWVKHYGHISWESVTSFGTYQMSGSPLEQVGIRVNDVAALSKQASIAGKMGVFWSTLFKYPPILLSNLEFDNYVVIDYVKQFLKPEQLG